MILKVYGFFTPYVKCPILKDRRAIRVCPECDTYFVKAIKHEKGHVDKIDCSFREKE